MSAQRELHVNSVVHPGAEQQRDGHEVHEVPSPARRAHDGQQQQEGKRESGEAEKYFRRTTKNEPQGSNDDEQGSCQEPNQAVLDMPVEGGSKQ